MKIKNIILSISFVSLLLATIYVTYALGVTSHGGGVPGGASGGYTGGTGNWGSGGTQTGFGGDKNQLGVKNIQNCPVVCPIKQKLVNGKCILK